MHPFLAYPFAATISALTFVVVRWLFTLLVVGPWVDPMQHLPGPRGPFFSSHLRQVMDPEYSTDTYREWRHRFGKTFSFHGFGKHDLRLMSFDFRVIAHVMCSDDYQKPWQTRSFLGRLIGRGIFSQTGDAHDMQRRIVAPAFRDEAVKKMTPVFFMKAEELVQRWKGIIAENTKAQSLMDRPTWHSAVVDVAHWISRATFDCIGLAGFSYDFHALKDESEEVYGAYRRMFNIADKGLGLWQILELYFPILRKIWVDDDIRTTNQSLKIISEKGKDIIAQRKLAYQSYGTETNDLMSLLIQSNLLSDSPRKLTDQELLDQCSTFLLAGSDSVSVALSWCFHYLAQNPKIQNRLRDKIMKAHDSGYRSDDSGFQEWYNPGSPVDDIEGLPYLDHVVRETLRLCPPVHATIRVATQDDYIPISHPITLANGELLSERGRIHIRKGTYVHIPLEGFSHSEDIWGNDALEFNPSRWEKVRFMDVTKPGINNLMTFGYGRSSCLGQKFTMLEMKIFIATLLPQFQFRPVEGVKISKFNTILNRPYVNGKFGEGTQLPISIAVYK